MVDFDTKAFKKEKVNQWINLEMDFLNRGLLFGDGLFETMIYTNGSIRFSILHQQRLFEGAKILGLDADGISDIIKLEQIISEKVGRQGTFRIRWLVYRGGLGKYTPEKNAAEEVVQIQPLQEGLKIKSHAYVCHTHAVPASPWSHCKTINALTYVMANNERKTRGMDEVILLTPQGLISEAGSSNIFWVKKNKFFTPSLDCNCISGIGRRMIIQELLKESIPITEGKFLPDDLLDADQIFTSNVTGISYIKSVGSKIFDVNEIGFLEKIFTLKSIN